MGFEMGRMQKFAVEKNEHGHSFTNLVFGQPKKQFKGPQGSWETLPTLFKFTKINSSCNKKY